MHHTSTISHWQPNKQKPVRLQVIAEEPLAIRVQGKPYVVIMRTPGLEVAHAVGFCLAEGLIDTYADIKTIAFCDGADTNTITVTLTEERLAVVGDQMERRGYISQSSCGICGKELITELTTRLRPVGQSIELATNDCYDKLERLAEHQPLRKKTRAAHAAVIYDANYEVLAVAEDVGRHNALDKAVGQLVQENRLAQAVLVTLSSRVSYEMVQKAVRAQIPIVLASSLPTELAVVLAERLNLTIACLARDEGLLIFTHPERLV